MTHTQEEEKEEEGEEEKELRILVKIGTRVGSVCLCRRATHWGGRNLHLLLTQIPIYPPPPNTNEKMYTNPDTHTKANTNTTTKRRNCKSEPISTLASIESSFVQHTS